MHVQTQMHGLQPETWTLQLANSATLPYNAYTE